MFVYDILYKIHAGILKHVEVTKMWDVIRIIYNNSNFRILNIF